MLQSVPLSSPAPRHPFDDCFALSRRGAARQTNQDNYLLGATGAEPLIKDQAAAENCHSFCGPGGPLLFGIADGVGGGRAGEVASHFVLQKVAHTITRLMEPAESPGGEVNSRDAAHGEVAAGATQRSPALALDVDALHSFDVTADLMSWAVRLTEKALVRHAKRQRGCGMATTLSLALVEGSQLALVHAGDSRGYLLGEDGLVQITEDQTLAQSWYERGPGARGETLPPEMFNVLENCLRSDGEKVRPVTYRAQLEPSTQLMLCSDGVSAFLSQRQIEHILVSSATARDAATRLVQEARAAGSLDDTTVVVAASRS